MSRYDGLIIPRSYSEYINKTDAATLSQALQLNNALDDTPTENSRGGVRSGGVYDALAGKQPTLTFDDTPTDGSANPVKSNGIYDALAGKQNTLTFDDAPTANSNNPVKSGGVKSYVDNMRKYSTTEVNTGKVWTDGKPIYRKVIDFGVLPNAADKAVNHNITNLDKMLLITGTTANGQNVFPLPYSSPSDIMYNIMLYTTNTQIFVRTGYDRRDYTATRIILEYTKS